MEGGGGGREARAPSRGWSSKHTRDPTGEETKAETLAAAGAGHGRPKPGRPALRLPLLSLAAVAQRRISPASRVPGPRPPAPSS